MKGLNYTQVEKVLNHKNWICEIPGCEEKPVTVGFKIDPFDHEFVKEEWLALTMGEKLSDFDLVKIFGHEKNTFRSCKKHRRELGINVDVDPDEAVIILESIYRAENAE